MAKRKKDKNRNHYYEMNEIESDENFAYIVGYTSGGAPYGVTWEEWEELGESDRSENDTSPEIDDSDLPF